MNSGYKAYVPHGITFIDTEGTAKNTWKDWKIVPTSRPVFQPPTVKREKIEIPGADGILDMTESLTGEIRYNNRTGTVEFQVENRRRWNEVYSDIMDYLHGQQMKAILNDELNYYYSGRFSVNEWKSEEFRSKISIDYDVEPYKYERYGSLEDWVWDPFCFEGGIIRNYRDLEVDGNMTLAIPGRRKKVVPVFICSSEMKLEYGGRTYTLPKGRSKILDLRLGIGEHLLTFTGRGTVSVDYRGARL